MRVMSGFCELGGCGAVGQGLAFRLKVEVRGTLLSFYT